MKKRFISLLLAVVMIMSVFPANLFVFAEGEETNNASTAIGKMVKLSLDTNAKFYESVTSSALSTYYNSYVESKTVMYPLYAVVSETVTYSGAEYYKLATVDGSYNNILAETSWISASYCQIVGAPPSSFIGAVFEFSYATMVLYETVTQTTLGEQLYPTDLPAQAMIVAQQEYISDGKSEIFYQITTVDGSSHDTLDKLPWVSASMIKLVAFPTQNEYIEGQVDLIFGGETATEIVLDEGAKEHVFTELSAMIGEGAKYQWQMLVPGNGWGNISDYIYPYAVISEALIKNALDENGKAYLRCLVTDGDLTFVSGEVAVSEKGAALSLFSMNRSLMAASETDATDAGTGTNSKSVIEGAFQIVIDYKFLHETSAIIQQNYTAAPTFTITLTSGSFNGEIKNPIIQGYKSYVVTEDTDADGVIYYGEKYLIPSEKVIYENQSEARIDTIYYVPQTVQFVVNTFKQNLYDDEYSPAGTLFLDGRADYTIADFEKGKISGTAQTLLQILAANDSYDFTGFSALYYDPDIVITPDGRATIDIYFDRIYYLVDYTIGDDAYGVMPNYVRYGTTVMLGTPVRPGYTFNGWSLTSVKDETGNELLTDENKTTTYINYNVTAAGSTISVAHNLDYTASWTATRVSYTVIYWRENANDNGFSIWNTETITGVSAGQVVDCSGRRITRALATTNGVNELPYFTYNSSLSDKTVIVKGDGTSAANIYYTRNLYHVLFTAGSNQGATTCRIAEHTHGTGCCSIEGCDHTSGTCKLELYCTLETHTHTEAECGAPICGKTEHASHTADCLTCGKTESSHTTACYEGVGDAALTQDIEGQKIDGYIGRFSVFGYYRYYIYISGTWYRYSGELTYGRTAEPSEGCTCHVHNEDCYKDKIHVHDSSCYACGIEGHTHTEDCYQDCIIYEHTHNNCNRYLYVISAKYNADISEVWPVSRHVEEWKTNGWLANSVYYDGWGNYVTKRIDLVSELCRDNTARTLTLTLESRGSQGQYTVEYYFESIDQTAGEGKVERNGIYYEEDMRYHQKGIPNSSLEPKDILGMEATQSSVSATNGILKFYYTRNSYTLTYVNDTEETSVTLKYGAPIVKPADPDIPASKEENSVQFAGWYTTHIFAEGTEYTFDSNATMPPENMYLYAKWEPTEWNVQVYNTKDDADLGDTAKAIYNNTVLFGSMISESEEDIKATPTNENYIFAGWYYIDADDGNTEKRFDFNTMQIKKHYVIYAKWTSRVPVPYTIYYKYDNGTEYIDVAEPTKGYSLAAINKSFTAKAGSDMYDGYKTGYFPGTRSHTITMSEDTENTHTFVYFKSEIIYYRVKHVFRNERFADVLGEGNYEISIWYDEEVQTNKTDFSAKLTMLFNAGINSEEHIAAAIEECYPETYTDTQKAAIWDIITDLSPDAYQKDLIITNGSKEDNELVFQWQYRGEIMDYQVVHYFQTLDKDTDGYYIYESEYVEYYQGNFGITYTATPMEIYGFTFNEDDSHLSGSLQKPEDGVLLDGLILTVYYDRVSFKYQIVHNYGTEQVIDTNNTLVALYEQSVTVSAVNKDGYTVKGDAEQTDKITAENQQFVFYYDALVVQFGYQTIGGGTVDNPYEEVVYKAAAIGSRPTALPGYVFAGWFTDEEATKPVDTDWVRASNKLVPVFDETNVELASSFINFYAKFVPTSLTIIHAETTPLEDENQAFIYNISKKNSDETFTDVMDVVIIGKGSVTILGLSVGEYIITPKYDWAWRYAGSTSYTVTVPEDVSGATVNVTYETPYDYILSGNSHQSAVFAPTP